MDSDGERFQVHWFAVAVSCAPEEPARKKHDVETRRTAQPVFKRRAHGTPHRVSQATIIPETGTDAGHEASHLMRAVTVKFSPGLRDVQEIITASREQMK